MPNFIDCDQIRFLDKSKNFSRLAWCYGDLSALYILFLLSSYFPSQMDTIGMLEHVAKRRNEFDSDIGNTGICHGSSGISYIFFKLFIKTRNPCFEDACIYWLKKTLFLGNEPTGIAGFIFPENSTSLDLLTGISGIATVFLSFLNHDLVHWDESILLS